MVLFAHISSGTNSGYESLVKTVGECKRILKNEILSYFITFGAYGVACQYA